MTAKPNPRKNVKRSDVAHGRGRARRHGAWVPGGNGDPLRDVEPYDRMRMLPGLLPLMPSELGPDSPACARRICALLVKAERRERVRGVAGHWTYDLARHIALCRALKAERQALARWRHKDRAETGGELSANRGTAPDRAGSFEPGRSPRPDTKSRRTCSVSRDAGRGQDPDARSRLPEARAPAPRPADGRATRPRKAAGATAAPAARSPA
ncbi:hypothetical protein HDIA_1326 [Hartmannibacter diazotrophicus]|uniref:Uncharacterized protein n=1 Tax=Hartmannibacter diazotrophicus TaxID=1482074 RepID=A0A2C9D3G1_9HYPH|nr:hypothetical protein HDIA_1326 [Hartmannibacter diazotrophicus]